MRALLSFMILAASVGIAGVGVVTGAEKYIHCHVGFICGMETWRNAYNVLEKFQGLGEIGCGFILAGLILWLGYWMAIFVCGPHDKEFSS